jgi:hypothetical protein
MRQACAIVKRLLRAYEPYHAEIVLSPRRRSADSGPRSLHRALEKPNDASTNVDLGKVFGWKQVIFAGFVNDPDLVVRRSV